jgi:NAD(P)-dependent dehydrogenase (short-subunit alcohol dehydrogenase family)
MMGVLDGRVIAITGAAGGLGSAYARECAAQGARLVLNDIGATRDGSGFDPQIVHGLVDELKASGAEVVGNAEDIATMGGAARTLEQALDTFGRVDGLINSGGLLRDRMFVSLTEDDWDAVMVGHLRAHFCPMQTFAAHWREEAKAGRNPDAAIVATTSNAGLFVQPGQSNYATAKAGIAGLTVTVADELERYGIRVRARTARLGTDAPCLTRRPPRPARRAGIRGLLAGKHVLVTAAAGTGIGFAARGRRRGRRGDLRPARTAPEGIRRRARRGVRGGAGRDPVRRHRAGRRRRAVRPGHRRARAPRRAGQQRRARRDRRAHEMTDEQWHVVLDVTLTGTIRCTRRGLRTCTSAAPG